MLGLSYGVPGQTKQKKRTNKKGKTLEEWAAPVLLEHRLHEHMYASRGNP